MLRLSLNDKQQHHMKYDFKFFTLSEMLHSETAVKSKIWNGANAEQENNLCCLISEVLEPVRAKIGKPISVTSGFRCPRLNAKVGGETHSQHQQGMAADICLTKGQSESNKILGQTIINLNCFDQVIFEDCGANDLKATWIHVSHRPDGNDRRQILKKVKGKRGYIVLRREDVV